MKRKQSAQGWSRREFLKAAAGPTLFTPALGCRDFGAEHAPQRAARPRHRPHHRRRPRLGGILVTSFLGGNSNATTGIFSLGVVGFRFEKGEKKEPIAEMNISGNHNQLWTKLVATGNDPHVYSSIHAPSLVLEGVSVAGK
jgi:hypothetical protein